MSHPIQKSRPLILSGIIIGGLSAVFQPAPLTLAALSPPPASILTETSDSNRSAILLAKDFELTELHQMPRSSSDLWHFQRRDYPAANAVEWQVRLHAPDRGSSPLFEDVRSADFVATFPADSPVTLHWSKGSHDEPSDFQPRENDLMKGQAIALESFGGRSSDGVMPYFNLAARGGGLIIAVGWTGDWKASFESLGGARVHVATGLKRSHFKLQPGEQVRLPSVLMMGYHGDWLEGQNQFRRLMRQHFTPTNLPPMKLMPVAASVHGMIGFNDTTEENLTALAADIAAKKLPLDTFWLDAGWNAGGFPQGQGNLAADPVRFPHGLEPVGAVARKAGMRFLAWFEPERAMRGSELDRKHAGWLLQPSNTPRAQRYQEKDGFRLLDLGNSDARQWAIKTVSAQIQAAGIGIYRQDFNLYPPFFWQTNEETNRIGLREIRHITGLYDYLVELARRHPGLILDNCASGGRRLDFEMMRRCVVLWRSDSCWGIPSFPRNVQAMTHGLSFWLPLHGLGAAATDEIALRSGMGSCATFAINYRDATAVDALRKHLDRFIHVRPLFAADYYPLTPWSDDPAKWLAWQFHEPSSGRGVVQAFCGPKTAERSFRLKFQSLDPTARYEVTNWDLTKEVTSVTGAELMTNGFPVLAPPGNAAQVIEYSPLQ